MATEKKSEKETEERAVDPPEATDTEDAERKAPRQWVRVDHTVQLSLPSGASYAFSAGDVLRMQAEDAAFIVEQGYGAKTTKPSAE